MDPSYAYSFGFLAAMIPAGYVLVRLPLIRRFYLPTALGAGLLILILGPQVIGKYAPELQIPVENYELWSKLPAHLINIVFAGLLLAKPVLSLKKMWRLAGPQVAFGQMMAWGQYALGGLLALLVLIPFFNMPAISGALIEISFEGGHGTVAGMTPVFKELGFEDGQQMATALATMSLLTALLSGIILINWGRRRGHLRPGNVVQVVRNQIYHRQIIVNLHKKGIRLRQHITPWRLVSHLALIGMGVLFGWLIRQGFIIFEQLTWGQGESVVFHYVPLFSFCMFGGIIAQFLWRRLKIEISREMVEIITAVALTLLIATAIGTMSLEFHSAQAASLGLLYLTGVIWILASFVLLAKRMFKRYWFQNAIIDMGQSMGMTATGLLFAQMTDPKNRTNAVEAFGYKQLMFEPLMGGGMITALSMPIIMLIGLPLFTAICAVIAIAWMLAGLLYFGKR